MKVFFSKWLAFFNPVKGWKTRRLQFKGGNTTWEVPGHPECSKVVPWPVQWIPHRQLTAAEVAAPAALQARVDEDPANPDLVRDLAAAKGLAERGFAFVDCTCVDSGKAAGIGIGVLCVRCGVPLHPDSANMISGFDPPHCDRCHWPLLLLGK